MGVGGDGLKVSTVAGCGRGDGMTGGVMAPVISTIIAIHNGDAHDHAHTASPFFIRSQHSSTSITPHSSFRLLSPLPGTLLSLGDQQPPWLDALLLAPA